MTAPKIGPVGYVCEHLFLDRKNRRHRRQFRVALCDARSHGANYKRRQLTDPSELTISAMATSIVLSRVTIPPDTTPTLEFAKGLTDDLVAAMRPRFWEVRRRRRRWWLRNRGKLLGPRVGTV